jgi:hypothetical protein
MRRSENCLSRDLCNLFMKNTKTNKGDIRQITRRQQGLHSVYNLQTPPKNQTSTRLQSTSISQTLTFIIILISIISEYLIKRAMTLSKHNGLYYNNIYNKTYYKQQNQTTNDNKKKYYHKRYCFCCYSLPRARHRPPGIA